MNNEVSYFLELNEENNDKDNGTNNIEPQPNEISTNQVETYVLRGNVTTRLQIYLHN